MSTKTDPEAIRVIIRWLLDLYRPRPTPWDGLTPDEAVAREAVWTTELSRFSVDLIVQGVHAWRDGDSGHFCPSLNDLMTCTQEVARKVAAVRMLQRGAGHGCDGTGWIEAQPGLRVPCATCDPVLTEIHRDDRLFARYEAGQPVWEILGYESRKALDAARPMPRRCEPFDGERALTVAEGMAIAKAAYEAECVRQGRKPDPRYFAKVMSDAALA